MSTGARRADPTRQEQQRAATYDAIVAAARTLLAQRRDLTVRGIAAEMGASPAGLYRYVANLDELRDLVAVSIDETLRADLVAAVATVGVDDVAARWLLAWVRLRHWALAHPDEFGLVLARPRSSPAPPCELSNAFLGACLQDLTTHLDVRLPAVPPAVVPSLGPPVDRPATGGWSAALAWLHVRVLASLHGVVALEVAGFLDPGLVDDGGVFRATVVEWLARLVRADDLGRLLAVLDTGLAR